jgi:hypothetical protein
MTAYLIRISTELFGKSDPFTVRFPFLVMSFLTTYFVYRTSKELFGDPRVALVTITLFNLAPMTVLGGAMAMHDNALIFFWTLCLWSGVKFIRSSTPSWFYGMGICSGLALQSKYTGVLAAFCILLFLLTSKAYRKFLYTKEPWIGLVICILFGLPILYWNWLHDWASVYHVLYIGSGSPTIMRRITDGLGYHLAQFLMVSPLLYPALISASFRETARQLKSPDDKALLMLSFGFPLLLFGVLAFKGHMEANWAVMGYVSLGILAVKSLTDSCSMEVQGRLGIFCGSYTQHGALVSIVLVLIVLFHGSVGLLPAFLEKRIAKEDRIIWETWKWDGLGRHIGDLMKPDDVIAADSYQLSAILEFYVPNQPFVRYLSPWKRPTQFDVRNPSFDDLMGKTILFVSQTELKPSGPELSTIHENFAEVHSLKPYEILYHGETIRKIFVYRGTGFNPFEPKRLGPRSLFYTHG